jgi:hypothetical protein
LAFLKNLSSYLIRLNVAKNITNIERMQKFKTLIVPFIKRKLIVLYDISVNQRSKIMHIINHYVSKWNDDNEDIELLVNIWDIVSSMDDTYIKNNFNTNDYECIRDSKLIIHDKKVVYNYENVHEKENLDKVFDDLNNFNEQQNAQNDISI